MEFKGTKREWKVSDIESVGRKMVALGDFKGHLDVWYHSGDTMTKDEALANAKLIAAAPDLLKELKRMTLSMQAHPDCQPDSEFQDYVNSSWEAINKALK